MCPTRYLSKSPENKDQSRANCPHCQSQRVQLLSYIVLNALVASVTNRVACFDDRNRSSRNLWPSGRLGRSNQLLMAAFVCPFPLEFTQQGEPIERVAILVYVFVWPKGSHSLQQHKTRPRKINKLYITQPAIVYNDVFASLPPPNGPPLLHNNEIVGEERRQEHTDQSKSA